MPVKVRPETQILADIQQYKSLVKKIDNAKDIPTQRAKTVRSKRSRKSTKNASRNSKSKEKSDMPTLAERTRLLADIKQRIFSQKPSFLGKSISTRFGTKQGNETSPFRTVMGASDVSTKPTKPQKTSCSIGNVSKISSCATTFEHNLQVEKDYEQMIELVRHNTDQLDFGSQWGILPKNIKREQQRFDFDYGADKVMLFQPGSFLGSDIDLYFRQLGQTFTEPHARDAPLI